MRIKTDLVKAEFPDVYMVPGVGYCGPQWQLAEAARYGNLARVASAFYITTGNPAELTAATVYATLAARAARQAVQL